MFFEQAFTVEAICKRTSPLRVAHLGQSRRGHRPTMEVDITSTRRYGDQISVLTVLSTKCGKCLGAGDPWIRVRLRMTCGEVDCCDPSKKRHTSAHARGAGRPIAASVAPDNALRWRHADEVGL